MEYLTSEEALDILQGFVLPPESFRYSEVPRPLGDAFQALQDVIVQNALVYMFATGAGVAHAAVPLERLEKTKRNMAYFYRYINRIGKGQGYELYQVTGLREDAKAVFEKAAGQKNVLHPLLRAGWNNRCIIRNESFVQTAQDGVYMRFVPEGIEPSNIFAGDELLAYLNCFERGALVPISAFLQQGELEHNLFFKSCCAMGHELVFAGRMNEMGCFTSMGLLVWPWHNTGENTL